MISNMMTEKAFNRTLRETDLVAIKESTDRTDCDPCAIYERYAGCHP